VAVGEGLASVGTTRAHDGGARREDAGPPSWVCREAANSGVESDTEQAQDDEVWDAVERRRAVRCRVPMTNWPRDEDVWTLALQIPCWG
jgi:hypothetical protein